MKTKAEMIWENLQSIEEWALAGISEREMAEMLEMSYSTFREQKRRISALSALLKKCADSRKEILKKQVEQVETSLFKRAIGYNVENEKAIKLKKTKFGEGGERYTDEVVEYVKDVTHIPADINAVKFFLLNKARKEWSNDPDKLEIDKKRLANDTKRTKIAEQVANKDTGDGETLEDVLKAAEADGEC